MKFLSLVLITLCTFIQVHAQLPDKNTNKTKTTASELNNIRVYIEYYEIPTINLAEVMSHIKPNNNNTNLRNKFLTLAKEGKAKLLDSQTITSVTNQKVTTKSVAEFIYSIHYNYSKPSSKKPDAPILGLPQAFQDQDLGSTLDIAISETDKNNILKIELTSETDSHLGDKFSEVFPTSQPIAKVPSIYRNRLSTTLHLKHNQFHLMGTFTPTKNKKLNTNNKILLFIKPTILRNNS